MNYNCDDCNGTGKDQKKTLALAKNDAEFAYRVKHHGSYVMCWSCNGNGLDPAKFFNRKH